MCCVNCIRKYFLYKFYDDKYKYYYKGVTIIIIISRRKQCDNSRVYAYDYIISYIWGDTWSRPARRGTAAAYAYEYIYYNIRIFL